MNTFEKPKIEIAEIFNRFKHLLETVTPQQHKIIQAITSCRTHALGGHRVLCGECEFEKKSYNSCRNRHCPKCQFLPQVRWIEKRSEDLLPCQYFHVVFTVPSELNPLILRNKERSYNVLFKAASETLKEVAQNPKHLGAEIGFIGVLHTWGQNLLDHPHIHFIIPGGGLNKKRTQWVHCKDGYFLPVQVLSKVFRGKVLELFEKAFDGHQLKFMGQIEHLCQVGNFKEVIMKSAQKDWVVYAKEPFGGPEQVIKYLGQYTHRIAISNFRLVKLEGEKIHFKVRDRDCPGKRKIMVLHVEEFMRRFLLHALPKGYVRIRHFGLLGSRLKKEKIAIVRRLKGVVQIVKEKIQLSGKELLKNLTGFDPDLCPNCGSSLMQIGLMNAVLDSS